MDQATNQSIEPDRRKQLHERAFFFKRLAIGAADPKFARKLQALVDEYESKAAQAELATGRHAAPRKSSGVHTAPERRTR